MSRMRKWLCLALVLGILGGCTACGRQQESGTDTDAAGSARSDVQADAPDSEDADEEEEDPDDDQPVDLQNVRIRGRSTDSGNDSAVDSRTDSRKDTADSTGTDSRAVTSPGSRNTAGTDSAAAGHADAAAQDGDAGQAGGNTGDTSRADGDAADSKASGNTGTAGSGSSAASGGKTGSDSSTGGSSSAGGTGNSGSAGTSGESADSTAADTPAPAEQATDAGTDSTAELPADTPDEAGEVQEQAEVSGVIDLSAGSFEGEGITFDSGHVLITGEGTYILTGSMTGMVEVNTVNKVKLKLSGTDINNPYGPAILCTDAKRLTITLIEGTSNVLTDGAGTAYDGVICSNDTLEIKGAGALTVNGNNAHGISSDDDIIVKNGEITVNAVKSGMMANDDITVSGGTLHVSGGTNGIKSKGTLHIEGGSIWTFGGPKETKSALYSEGSFTLTGGCVYALGCGAAQPDAGTSTQYSIAVRLTPSLEAGNRMGLVANDTWLMEETSPYACNTLFVSTPDITEGMECRLFINGEPCGDSFSTSGLATGAAVTR